MDARMKFGIFLAPFHRLGENPTLAIERDIELIEWLDQLGYDEAWIGEHHSAGWEIDRLARAVHRRWRPRAPGTSCWAPGVTSLPYHNPLMVAQPLRAARPHDARPGDARLRPRRACLRRLHAGHRAGRAAPPHGGVARRRSCACWRGESRSRSRPTGSSCATRGCIWRPIRGRTSRSPSPARITPFGMMAAGKHGRRRAVDRRRPARRAGGAGQAVEDRRGHRGASTASTMDRKQVARSSSTCTSPRTTRRPCAQVRRGERVGDARPISSETLGRRARPIRRSAARRGEDWAPTLVGSPDDWRSRRHPAPARRQRRRLRRHDVPRPRMGQPASDTMK